MRQQTIIHGRRLAETIREDLRRALAAESLRASEACEFYLVNLLTQYHEAGQLPELADSERAIGVKFMEAMNESGEARRTELKEIGDTTLIGLGFFAESVRRSIVDRSYYLSIGGGAYEALSGVVVADEIFARIYAELATNFAYLVRALSRMAPWNRAASDAHIINIYRRWIETGDARLAQLLRDAGVSIDTE